MRYPIIALLLLLALPGVASAQVAEYQGRRYTPSSFPKAIWHRCGMCEYIRTQWRAQGWSHPQDPYPQLQRTQVVVKPAVTSKVAVEYRLVNRPITKTVYQTQCINGVCRRIPVTTSVDNWVRVPVEQTKPALVGATPEPAKKAVPSQEEYMGTPVSVVPVMISLLKLDAADHFGDIGCGDGRLVIEAARTGAESTGVEIDPLIARKARLAIEKAGVEASVITADFKRIKLDTFTAVAVYQYPDILAEIIRSLKPGTRVVSYAHKIPGIDCQEIKTTEASIFFGVIPKPVVDKPKPLRFGL